MRNPFVNRILFSLLPATQSHPLYLSYLAEDATFVFDWVNKIIHDLQSPDSHEVCLFSFPTSRPHVQISNRGCWSLRWISQIELNGCKMTQTCKASPEHCKDFHYYFYLLVCRIWLIKKLETFYQYINNIMYYLSVFLLMFYK